MNVLTLEVIYYVSLGEITLDIIFTIENFFTFMHLPI